MDGVGGIVYSGQLLVAVPLALLAGLISFASPCVLPLVPGYLAYVGGMTSVDDKRSTRRLLLGVLLFVIGFSVVFVGLGIAFGALGFALKPWLDVITRVMGVVIIVMGLVFMGMFTRFQRTAKLQITPATGLIGAPLLGLVFGLGWTPCIGPTLTAIFSLSLDAASPGRGALLGAVYCVGLGIPFVLLASGFSWATRSVVFLKRHIRTINIIGGVMLVVMGTLMVTGLWTAWMYQLQEVIANFVPSL
jgi:cytochrome c-type biogenesis protein